MSDSDEQQLENIKNDEYARGRNDAANQIREMIYAELHDVIQFYTDEPRRVSITMTLQTIRETIEKLRSNQIPF